MQMSFDTIMIILSNFAFRLDKEGEKRLDSSVFIMELVDTLLICVAI